MAVDIELKKRVRAELFRCAVSGAFQTYTQFFNRIRPGATMGNFPYQKHFDEIAREERDLGYPDVTFVVYGVGGYPRQVNFRPFDPNDLAQLESLRHGTDDVLAMYSPGTENPYRPATKC